MTQPVSKPLPAVRLVEDEVFLIEPAWGQKLAVDGMPAPSGRFVVSDLSKVTRIVRKPAPLLHFQNKDDPDLRMSPERHAQELWDLLGDAGPDEDGDIDYQDLDQEFAHKKFLATWKPIYGESEVVHEPVEFEVVEVRRDSGDSDIVSLWNAPDVVDKNRSLYQVNLAVVEVREFRRLCTENNLVFEVPGHGVLEFAKIEGKYVFGNTYRRPNTSFIGTASACKAEKQKTIELIEGVVNAALAMKCGRRLSSVGATFAVVEDALRHLSNLSVKSGSAAGYRAGLSKLQELRAGLLEEAK